MPDQIPDDIKKDRITRLIATQNKVTREISKQMTGKVYEILVEGTNPKYDGVVCGRTESGRLVNFKGDETLIGQFVNVKIEKSASATLWGSITTEEK
jgi:tRNA-2-methylthio-N6-dimethylallyladenosine synthase